MLHLAANIIAANLKVTISETLPRRRGLTQRGSGSNNIYNELYNSHLNFVPTFAL